MIGADLVAADTAGVDDVESDGVAAGVAAAVGGVRAVDGGRVVDGVRAVTEDDPLGGAALRAGELFVTTGFSTGACGFETDPPTAGPGLVAAALLGAGTVGEPPRVSRVVGTSAVDAGAVVCRERGAGFSSRVTVSMSGSLSGRIGASDPRVLGPDTREDGPASPEEPPGAGVAVSLAGSTLLGEPVEDCCPRVLVRDSFRGDDESDDDEPADPVVSATATAGIEMIAAPTPSATASAPTRPT
jgi:hypothetical protein